jgi:hypothetical protein
MLSSCAWACAYVKRRSKSVVSRRISSVSDSSSSSPAEEEDDDGRRDVITSKSVASASETGLCPRRFLMT